MRRRQNRHVQNKERLIYILKESVEKEVYRERGSSNTQGTPVSIRNTYNHGHHQLKTVYEFFFKDLT